ncbi:prophage regulatory protein (plasmid) [Rahnella aquatilis HX2]|nr:prophage regulatory protein [Rahnella aquatilis HX2]
MITGFYFSALFWYGFVGVCTAQLHLYMDFYSRYKGKKLWICWSVILLFWPLTLPLFVDFISQRTAMTKHQLIHLIHIARNDLKMDEDTYRQMLQRLTGSASTKGMALTQLIKVLDFMKK